jgi:alkylated DNA repair protein (DNA oxidative demethylase)
MRACSRRSGQVVEAKRVVAHDAHMGAGVTAAPSSGDFARCRVMQPAQSDLFGAADGPEGLDYRPDFLSVEEEQELLARLAELPFRPFEFQDFTGKRETVSFGWSYRFDGSGLAPAEPLPGWLLPLRDKAASFAGLPAEAIEHALLIRYREGAGLGWHRDRPVFGDVIGISLLAPAPLRFRLKQGAKWRRFTLDVEPRSAYLLRGPARDQWEHSIPPVETLRFSLTFRTLRSRD